MNVSWVLRGKRNEIRVVGRHRGGGKGVVLEKMNSRRYGKEFGRSGGDGGCRGLRRTNG
jgi:hypothetical protein